MQILLRPGAAADQPQLVLLFGLGLIGRAIRRRLLRGGRATWIELPYDWQDPTLRQRQTEELEDRLHSLPGQWHRHIATVWAGGRSGFGSDDEAMAEETARLEEVIRLSERLRDRLPEARHDFHLLSSAGGLFEGQILCDHNSQPRPLRAYGRGKMAQEDLLQQSSAFDAVRIYRPSSVYGAARSGRIGLISTLLENGLTGRASTIFGGINTLRDYVWVEDIADYVAKTVTRPGPASAATAFLASGKPTAMCEVVGAVEQMIDRPLKLKYVATLTNARDMSFRLSALPRGLPTTDLKTGMFEVLLETRRYRERAL